MILLPPFNPFVLYIFQESWPYCSTESLCRIIRILICRLWLKSPCSRPCVRWHLLPKPAFSLIWVWPCSASAIDSSRRWWFGASFCAWWAGRATSTRWRCYATSSENIRLPDRWCSSCGSVVSNCNVRLSQSKLWLTESLLDLKLLPKWTQSKSDQLWVFLLRFY